MAVNNKMKQLADYFEEGPGSFAELQVGWGLDIVVAIIPVIACVPPD